MTAVAQIAAVLAPLAKESSGGSFLVSPALGLMIWTLALFFFTMWVLSKVAFPRIQEALEKRANAIADNIDASERQRQEAEELLQEYRKRLTEAREHIEAETRRSLEQIRKEVADLTILATEKVTRKTLTGDDHKRLIDDALSEVDFTARSPKTASCGSSSSVPTSPQRRSARESSAPSAAPTRSSSTSSGCSPRSTGCRWSSASASSST